MMDLVTSPRNPRVVAAAKLARARERRRRGEMLLEGPHLVGEAVRVGVGLRLVFGTETDTASRALADRAGTDWIPCTEEVLQRLGATEHPRGPIAVAAIPEETFEWGRDAMVVDLRDPGNAGTLIRTAAAFGLDIAFTGDAVDVWAPKVLRAGAGAHFLTCIGIGISVVPDHVGTIATVAEGGVILPDAMKRLDPSRVWAALVGSEPHGLSAAEVAGADLAVTIPMPGNTESLNAAVAGSIVAYELACWRSAVGTPSVGH
jgi:TrmH family RNA methyltransferase